MGIKTMGMGEVTQKRKGDWKEKVEEKRAGKTTRRKA